MCLFLLNDGPEMCNFETFMLGPDTSMSAGFILGGMCHAIAQRKLEGYNYWYKKE